VTGAYYPHYGLLPYDEQKKPINFLNNQSPHFIRSRMNEKLKSQSVVEGLWLKGIPVMLTIPGLTVGVTRLKHPTAIFGAGQVIQ